MSADIQRAVADKGITRLCHFTPSRNLPPVVADKRGVLSTRNLKAEEQAVFTATDAERLDGYQGHVCCSVEYPNSWYLKKARANEMLFHDWVILFIQPSYLALSGTGFCPRNAAAGRGRYVGFGPSAFEALYAPSVVGAGGKTRTRSPTRLQSCPTDEQAEILVPDLINFADIMQVAVRSETQARNEFARFQIAGLPADAFTFVVAPELFDPYALSSSISDGRRPSEIIWKPKPIC